jgi:hypothetical protein
MRLLITALIFLAVSIPAQAAHRHHHQRHYAGHHHAPRSHHRVAAKSRRHREAHVGRRQHRHTATRGTGGMVTVSTAAGPITVASHLADRFKALIADFVAAGYKPRRIGCLAHGGHVPHSRHYAGAACDFDQRGWGQTVPFMYHAHAIIAKHGFRDGCSFNDCGHVDDGKSVHYASRRYDDDFGG